MNVDDNRSKSSSMLREELETNASLHIEDIEQYRASSQNSNNSIIINNIPSRLKKTFFCSLSLLIIGIILLSIGIEEWIRNKEFYNGMPFIILSIIVLIPGLYYIYQFMRAKLTNDQEERREIYNEIPDFN